MDGGLTIDDRLVIPAAELQWRFSASGGPGGQHANKASTKAEVVYDIATSAVLSQRQRQILRSAFGDQVAVSADDTRSQARNRELARDRLAARLRTALRPRTPRRATKPTRGSRERRLQDKRRRARLKADRQRPKSD